MTGKVKRVVRDKGFGFIKDKSGMEWFFHRSGAREFDDIQEGDAVEFEEESNPKGPRATNVQRI